ncbi:MAG: NupC/NupG family nucleoside CNT transporter [Chlamydiota bacterium]
MFSTNRRAIRVKTVAWGLGLQFTFAVLVLRWEVGRRIFQVIGDYVTRLLSYSFAGSEFVFGELGKKNSHLGMYFAFQVLPTIIFIAAFFAVLYHFGIMQFIIRQAARVMTRFMGASGAESLNVAASIFMGQTEAPLTIRPYLPDVTRSELMTIMTSGMAHVSGGIMAAYIMFGIDAKALLSAVIMTAPGTILISKMLVPETEKPLTAGKVELAEAAEDKSENAIGAVARGTIDGLHLALNVGAMLISFLALIALTNGILGGIHNGLAHFGFTHFPESLQTIFGTIFAPIAWLIGIPWKDCMAVGNLLGTRMVMNELVAFSLLGPQKAVLAQRSFTIATFALTGFANFSSIGIQIGGIGALAPNKKGELARLGLRAMLAGTMANLMSASIAGMLL